MNVVRAFVGIDRLEIQYVLDHVELIDDAVAAMHVARRARYLQRLAAGIALEDRRDLRRGLPLVLETPEPQARLQSDRDFGLHVRELLLDELIRGERAAELFAVEHVLTCRVPAE